MTNKKQIQWNGDNNLICPSCGEDVWEITQGFLTAPILRCGVCRQEFAYYPNFAIQCLPHATQLTLQGV